MLTPEILQPYLVAPNKIKTHPFYERSVLITNHLEAHSKGKYPKDIIEVARPNETPDQKSYRQNAYTPITQTYFSKVIGTLTKIGRAEDWKIKWNDFKGPVTDDETLEEYTCENYPSFDSLINWFFSLQLREMCDDPNGVVAIFPFPKENPEDDTELLKPFTFWFESDDVIEYQEGKLAVLKSAEKSIVNDKGGQEKEGLIYYVFDADSWTKCTQTGNKDDYHFEIDIQHHAVGYVPCFKIGGIIEEFENGEMLYDSFVGDCLPFWDEALRRYSDQQVQMVLHVHSEKWEIEDTPCKTCNGSGEVRNSHMGANSAKLTCGSCHGSGNVGTRTPFGVKTIKPQSQTGLNTAVNIPIPPMGYIDKPIEQTQFIKDEVKDNISNGLAAINMEFLMFEPEVNSGVAKTLDRQEMNTFFYTVARHIVENILNPSYYIIAKWRYGMIMSEDDIIKSLPIINIPTKFDLLTEDILAQRLSNAKAAGLSSGMMAELEIEYAKKEFGEESQQAKKIETIANLDPFPNKTEDEKMTILSNKGTTQNTYILSCNLTSFINRAYAENDDFYDLSYSDQMNILNEYVQDIIDAQNAAIIPIVKLPKTPVEYVTNEGVNPNGNPGGSKTQGGDDDALDNTPNGVSLPTKGKVKTA